MTLNQSRGRLRWAASSLSRQAQAPVLGPNEGLTVCMDPPKASGNGGKNHTAALLSTLAQSGNKWVQLATVGLVALSGIGNWVATWNSGDKSRTEIEISRRVAYEGEQRIRQEVQRQVSDIHKWMSEATDEFHRGNADSADNKKILMGFQSELTNFEERQVAALNNQTKMLQNQTQILEGLHAFVKEKERQP